MEVLKMNIVKQISNSWIGLLRSFILGILGGIFIIYTVLLYETISEPKTQLSEYEERYLHQSGWSLFIDDEYHLFSNDGGQHWYAIIDNVIVGEADEIYPGLVKHLQSVDDLIEYVEKNGPITLKSTEEFKLLEDNGFSIRKKK